MNNRKDSLRDQIYLAALLHDIGKFYQRADTGSVKSSKFLDNQVRQLDITYCPIDKIGNKTHKHVLWTAQFITDFSDVFQNLLRRVPSDLPGKDDTLISLASGHHLSKDQLSSAGRFIKEADCLSSGMDRNSEEAMKDDQDESNWDSFKKKRMVSLFEGIGRKEHRHKYHLPVEAINLTDALIPKESFSKDPDYESLWNDFINEFKFIQADSFRSFSETLLHLLFKYTSSIPSSTVNFPDVSLFDHSKTTAAMAVCLHDSSIEEIPGKEPFLLVGGDMSGIQSYIYNVISENAAKNLKGRSLYLKLLSDSIVYYLLKELNLYEANVVYNAGGSFFLLVPNTAENIAVLENCREHIETNILNVHGTDLFLAFDWIVMPKDALSGLNGQSIGEYWNQLFEKRDTHKKRRYQGRLVNEYSAFFEPSNLESGGETTRDSITGDEIGKGKACFTMDGKILRANEKSDPASGVISEITWKQIELGKKLKSATIWVIADSPLSYWGEEAGINPAGLGIYHYFLAKDEISRKSDALKGSADHVRVITINGDIDGNCDFLDPVFKGFNNIFGVEFYGGNDYPRDKDGTPKTFDELAGVQGFKRLGILRMDVDNLGLIFKTGLSGQRSTISRYSALSRYLDWFFKGHLNAIWKSTSPDSTYIIYSGGDDLFLVGRWNELLKLAERINAAFNEMVCHNQNLTISGGLILVSGKYPIKKAAKECGEAEGLAKSFAYGTERKNAISILGYPIRWTVEMKIVQTIKDRLIPFLIKDSLPKSFISKVGIHANNTRIVKGKLIKNHTVRINTLWMMAYDFSRLSKRTKDPEAREFIEDVKKGVFTNSYKGQAMNSPFHFIELLNLACRLSELELKTEN